MYTKVIKRLIQLKEIQLAKLVEAVAGRFYNIVTVKGNNLYLNALSPTQITYFIAKDGKLYKILSLKKNSLFDEDKIEEIMKTYGKKAIDKIAEEAGNKVKYFKKVNLQELSNILFIKESFHEREIDEWFPEITEERKKRSIKVGKFNFLPGSLRDEDLFNIKYVLNKSTKLLKTINLDKSAYGDVIIVDKLPGTATAIYDRDSDIIKIEREAAFLQDFTRPLHDTLHEIAHRIYRKKYVNTKAVDDKFLEVYKEWKENGNSDMVPSLFSVKKSSKRWATEWFSEVVAYGLLKNNRKLLDFVKKVSN